MQWVVDFIADYWPNGCRLAYQEYREGVGVSERDNVVDYPNEPDRGISIG